MQEDIKTKQRIYTMSFARVYPLYIAKVERKGRTKTEVDEVIRWLTGYSQKELETQIEKEKDPETFFAEAQLNPSTFYRANRQYIIHRNSIKEIERYFSRKLVIKLSVKTPENIVVSKVKAGLFLSWMKSTD